MSKFIQVVNNEGVPFNVKVVEQGEQYGRNNQLVHEKKDALVEFYDARQDPERFSELGQFVSRYYMSTLVEHEKGYGLYLDTSVPSWQVSDKNMGKIQVFLEEFNLESSKEKEKITSLLKRSNSNLPIKLSSESASYLIQNYNNDNDGDLLGLFYEELQGGMVVGIDNSTGHAWVEEFQTLDECKQWLGGSEVSLVKRKYFNKGNELER